VATRTDAIKPSCNCVTGSYRRERRCTRPAAGITFVRTQRLRDVGTGQWFTKTTELTGICRYHARQFGAVPKGA
jgi:hypothetical protein